MSDPRGSLLQRSWSAIERELSPRVDALVGTSDFGRAVGILTGVNAFARRRAAAAVGRIWHLLNLPTGTDVARLRREVGALDRELRRLAMQLESYARDADRSPMRGSDDADSDAAEKRNR
jgi:hypothetical protein